MSVTGGRLRAALPFLAGPSSTSAVLVPPKICANGSDGLFATRAGGLGLEPLMFWMWRKWSPL